MKSDFENRDSKVSFFDVVFQKVNLFFSLLFFLSKEKIPVISLRGKSHTSHLNFNLMVRKDDTESSVTCQNMCDEYCVWIYVSLNLDSCLLLIYTPAPGCKLVGALQFAETKNHCGLITGCVVFVMKPHAEHWRRSCLQNRIKALLCILFPR